MTEFIKNIGEIIVGSHPEEGEPVPGLIDFFADIGSSLIANEVFQIMLAIILFILLFGLLVGLAKSIKSRKGR